MTALSETGLTGLRTILGRAQEGAAALRLKVVERNRRQYENTQAVEDRMIGCPDTSGYDPDYPGDHSDSPEAAAAGRETFRALPEEVRYSFWLAFTDSPLAATKLVQSARSHVRLVVGSAVKAAGEKLQAEYLRELDDRSRAAAVEAEREGEITSAYLAENREKADIRPLDELVDEHVKDLRLDHRARLVGKEVPTKDIDAVVDIANSDLAQGRKGARFVSGGRHNSAGRPKSETANDVDAIRVRLGQLALDAGYPLDELVARAPAGKPSPATAARLDALGAAVRSLSVEGFTFEAIGSVIGLSKPGASDLAKRGT
jgi:hypothetical protein